MYLNNKYYKLYKHNLTFDLPLLYAALYSELKVYILTIKSDCLLSEIFLFQKTSFCNSVTLQLDIIESPCVYIHIIFITFRPSFRHLSYLT